VCLVVCFMLLLVVCCRLANKDIYILTLTGEYNKSIYGAAAMRPIATITVTTCWFISPPRRVVTGSSGQRAYNLRRVGSSQESMNELDGGPHWRHLANTTE